MFCMNCGTQLPDGAKFCMSCGTKMPALATEQLIDRALTPVISDASKQPVPDYDDSHTTQTELQANNDIPESILVPKYRMEVGGYTLEIDQSIIDYNIRQKRFIEAAEKSRVRFENYYKENIHDFSSMYGNAIPFYLQEVVKAAEFGYHELSRLGGSIDQEDYISRVLDAARPMDFLRYYTEFANSIMYDAQDKAQRLAQSYSNRPRWQGGGFGISGAVKGWLTAEALNIGTDLVQGLGVSMAASGQRARYTKMLDEFYQREDHCRAFGRQIISQWMQVFRENESILYGQGLIVWPELDYGKSVSPLLEAYNLVTREPDKLTEDICEKAFDLAIHEFPHYPYDVGPYVVFYATPYIRNDDVYKLAEFFGMEADYLSKIKDYDQSKILYAQGLPEHTLPQIDIKIKEYERMSTIDLSKEINRLRKMKQQIAANAEKYPAIKELPEDTAEQIEYKYNSIPDTYITEEMQVEKKRLQAKLEEAKVKLFEENIERYKEIQGLPEDTLEQIQFKYDSLPDHDWLPEDYGAEEIRADKARLKRRIEKIQQTAANAEKYPAIKELPEDTAEQIEYKYNSIPNIYITEEMRAEKKRLQAKLEAIKGGPRANKASSKSPNTSSNGCFITSSVCRTFGKPDDCYELTAFRKFRDNWLRNQPGGQSLIQEYYQVAPMIVAQIDRQPDSRKVYQSIWRTYLLPCLSHIESNQFDQCRDTYVDMVNTLKAVYIKNEGRTLWRQ